MVYRKFPLPAKFICGFIYPQEETYSKTKKILERKIGGIDFESEIINFDFTGYYDEEMGKPLFRRFISFEKLRNPGDLTRIKLFCIKIEKKNLKDGKRKINIDPGYLNESKLVLATTKDFYHRLYLGKGIYAEGTLYYQGGIFCDFPTTYPDYRTSRYKNIFLSLRNIYCQQLEKKRQSGNRR